MNLLQALPVALFLIVVAGLALGWWLAERRGDLLAAEVDLLGQDLDDAERRIAELERQVDRRALLEPIRTPSRPRVYRIPWVHLDRRERTPK